MNFLPCSKFREHMGLEGCLQLFQIVVFTYYYNFDLVISLLPKHIYQFSSPYICVAWFTPEMQNDLLSYCLYVTEIYIFFLFLIYMYKYLIFFDNSSCSNKGIKDLALIRVIIVT